MALDPVTLSVIQAGLQQVCDDIGKTHTVEFLKCPTV